MPKYINANSFLEYEENRCKNFPPLIGTCSFDNATLREELANFFAADVEPVKHGHWTETVIPWEVPDYDCVCSLCGKSGLPIYNFCPNCGAKMDEENGE